MFSFNPGFQITTLFHEDSFLLSIRTFTFLLTCSNQQTTNLGPFQHVSLILTFLLVNFSPTSQPEESALQHIVRRRALSQAEGPPAGVEKTTNVLEGNSEGQRANECFFPPRHRVSLRADHAIGRYLPLKSDTKLKGLLSSGNCRNLIIIFLTLLPQL